jgi:hypothetical protein
MNYELLFLFFGVSLSLVFFYFIITYKIKIRKIYFIVAVSEIKFLLLLFITIGKR